MFYGHYREEKDELAQLRIKLYELEGQFTSHWIRNRLEWFLRAPLIRCIWFVAIVIGWILSSIKMVLGLPTFAKKYHYEILEASAKQKAGINEDFEDDFHRKALQSVVVNSLLHSEMKDFVSIVPFASMLEKKLRVQKWLKFCSKPRPAAVFIIGLPRTGSTILHQLCSLDERARAIRAWEFRMPFECSDAPADKLARIKQVQEQLDGFYKLAPAIKAVHYVRSLDADECVQGFFDCALPDWYLWGAINAPEAFNWYVNADMTQQYENYKKFVRAALEMDGEHSRPRNLWLKTPHHTYKLPELAKVFPEAKFVWLHRDPANAVGSCCSMNEAILDATCPYFVNPRILGERTLSRLAQCVNKGLADRKLLEKQGRMFVDVKYDDLKRDLVGTMKIMYNKLGLGDDFSENFINSLQNHAKGSSTQANCHRYSLDHFGLTKHRVHREFRQYMESYLNNQS